MVSKFAPLTVALTVLLQTMGCAVWRTRPPAPARTASRPAAAASELSYTVIPGDTLRKISQKTLGSRSAWQLLARANPEISPQHIVPGQVLRIPQITGATPGPQSAGQPIQIASRDDVSPFASANSPASLGTFGQDISDAGLGDPAYQPVPSRSSLSPSSLPPSVGSADGRHSTPSAQAARLSPPALQADGLTTRARLAPASPSQPSSPKRTGSANAAAPKVSTAKGSTAKGSTAKGSTAKGSAAKVRAAKLSATTSSASKGSPAKSSPRGGSTTTVATRSTPVESAAAKPANVRAEHAKHAARIGEQADLSPHSAKGSSAGVDLQEQDRKQLEYVPPGGGRRTGISDRALDRAQPDHHRLR